MHYDVLQLLGLPKNEAKIYEALLGKGPANVSTIANAAKVNRRNVYDSLKNLIKRRLVTKIRGERILLYKAEPPNKLQTIIEIQKKNIQSILPELSKLYQQHTPSEQAFISRGREGIKNFWQFVASQNETTYFVGGKGAWHDPAIEEDRKKYFEKCKEKNIMIKGIFDYEVIKWGKDIYDKYNSDLIKFLPKRYSSRATFDICDNRIVMFPMPQDKNIENTTVFTIISKPLADSYRGWFNLMWKNSKTLNELNEK